MIRTASILLLLLMLAGMLPGCADEKEPVVPANLMVPAGNKVVYHVYARGWQIYRCTQDKTDTDRYSWVFAAPQAALYSHSNFSHAVGNHYAGPTWESDDGSKVVGVKLQQADSPDPGAIPWLLLRTSSEQGSGLLSKITYIQRLNTREGKAPSGGADSKHKGQEIRVGYTAEYFFYRAASE